MKFTKISAVAAVLAFVCTSPSMAATPEEEASAAEALGQCFVLKSTGQDRLDFARWIGAAMASTSKLKDVVTVNPAAKDQLDQRTAQLFTRLMTVDCIAQAKSLSKMRSRKGFEKAGQAIGEIAMQELMNGAGETQMLSGYAKYLKAEDFQILEK